MNIKLVGIGHKANRLFLTFHSGTAVDTDKRKAVLLLTCSISTGLGHRIYNTMTKVFLHTVQSGNMFLFFRLKTLKSLTGFISLLPLVLRAATAAYPQIEAVWRPHAIPVAAWRLVMLTLIISVLLASTNAGLHHHRKSVLGVFCFRKATSDLVTSVGCINTALWSPFPRTSLCTREPPGILLKWLLALWYHQGDVIQPYNCGF